MSGERPSAGKRVLLLNPASMARVYDRSRVQGQVHPSLTLATLAAPLASEGHPVRVLDLTVEPDPSAGLSRELASFRPHVVGITFVTASYDEFKRLCARVKAHDPDVLVVAGGPHATAAPHMVLAESCADAVVLSEGDLALPRLVRADDARDVPGVVIRDGDGFAHTGTPERVGDLDRLPMPAWHLFDLKRYVNPRSFGLSPLGAIETSRGCPFHCVFCNKNIFGDRYRSKSPARVVEEFQYLKRLGFREAYISDDGFTTDLDRAKEICERLIREEVGLPWNLGNGIRVDRVDLEFLRLAKKAGCHRVHFGIEAADDAILERARKGITLEQVRRAFRLAKEAGIDTMAYFMLGLPGETPRTMQQTIDLAKELAPDFARVAVVVPLPGTELWDEWNEKGLILSREWDRYTFHDTGGEVYRHPDLDRATINHYYQKFYRDVYLRPSYLAKRVVKGIRRGTLFADGAYFVKHFVLKR